MPAARTGADALKIERVLTGPDDEVLSLHAIGTVSGVAVVAAAYRNGPGTGTMRYDPAVGLSWKAPGEERFGGAQLLVADGEYLIEGNDDRGKFLRVSAAIAYLPEAAQEAVVHLADRYGEATGIAGDVFAGESLVGNTRLHHLMLTNVGRAGMSRLKVWIDPTAFIGFELDDGAGEGGYRLTTEETAMDLGFLPVGGQVEVFAVTLVNAGSKASPMELNRLHFSWEGF